MPQAFENDIYITQDYLIKIYQNVKNADNFAILVN